MSEEAPGALGDGGDAGQARQALQTEDRRPVVAVVPAFRRADSVAATVAALLDCTSVAGQRVDEVVVVDDGSCDGGATARAAGEAGARVVVLATNVGKGGAVSAGVLAAPDAGTYLLIDADVGATATAGAAALLPLVLAGDADMTIAVLPRSGTSRGMGIVKGFARWGIRRGTRGACIPDAPLSGQRAVAGPLLRSLVPLAPRFGLEVGLSIDAARAGATLVEVPVAMTHRRTGWLPGDVAHRSRQGIDVVRALWPRLTSPWLRIALVVVAAIVAVSAALMSASAHRDGESALPAQATTVFVVGIPGLPLAALSDGSLPTLDLLAGTGAIGAINLRSLAVPPTAAAAWATVGAGERVLALPTETGNPTALAARNRGRHLSGRPGIVAESLLRAGVRLDVAGDRSTASFATLTTVAVPAADGASGEVPGLSIEPRVVTFVGGPLRYDAATAEALLGEVYRFRGGDQRTLVIVIGITPAAGQMRTAGGGSGLGLAPIVLNGAGVLPGSTVESPSTSRRGIATLADVGPTIARALGIVPPVDAVGRPIGTSTASARDAIGGRGGQDPKALLTLDRIGREREVAYGRIAVPFIVGQVAVYLIVIGLWRWRRRSLHPGDAGGRSLRVIVVGVAAFPAVSLLAKAVLPEHPVHPIALAGLAAAITLLALRARRHALSPLSWIAGLTVTVVALDLATGGWWQVGSLMGFGFASTSRFTGITNTTFATLAFAALLAGILHVAHAPRRSEALVTSWVLFAGVVVLDGAPTLGGDVGGILALAPAFLLVLVVLCGWRVRVPTLLIGGVGAAALLALATGFDLARPASSRTHLGRLADRILHEGIGPLRTTVARKVGANVAALTNVWSFVVIGIILLVAVALLTGLPGRQRIGLAWLVPGSVGRRAALALVLTALWGTALNDSGAIVCGQVFSYFGPLLVLLAIDHVGRTSTPEDFDPDTPEGAEILC